MKKKKPGAWRDKINASRRVHRPGAGKPSTRKIKPEDELDAAKPRPVARPRPATRPGGFAFDIVDKTPEPEPAPVDRTFRVLIAVHRPRYRGRVERAAALTGWNVTALLNKQDPVGIAQKPPRPPDLLILSEDFGRQRDLAIFRAVQKWRSQGMRVIGLVEDCATPPEGFPDSVPSRLCDVCLTPPYKASDLRALLVRQYEEMRGEPAPPPKTKADAADEDEENED